MPLNLHCYGNNRWVSKGRCIVFLDDMRDEAITHNLHSQNFKSPDLICSIRICIQPKIYLTGKEHKQSRWHKVKQQKR